LTIENAVDEKYENYEGYEGYEGYENYTTPTAIIQLQIVRDRIFIFNAYPLSCKIQF
jgi:hypothetical protein